MLRRNRGLAISMGKVSGGDLRWADRWLLRFVIERIEESLERERVASL